MIIRVFRNEIRVPISNMYEKFVLDKMHSVSNKFIEKVLRENPDDINPNIHDVHVRMKNAISNWRNQKHLSRKVLKKGNSMAVLLERVLRQMSGDDFGSFIDSLMYCELMLNRFVHDEPVSIIDSLIGADAGNVSRIQQMFYLVGIEFVKVFFRIRYFVLTPHENVGEPTVSGRKARAREGEMLSFLYQFQDNKENSENVRANRKECVAFVEKFRVQDIGTEESCWKQIEKWMELYDYGLIYKMFLFNSASDKIQALVRDFFYFRSFQILKTAVKNRDIVACEQVFGGFRVSDESFQKLKQQFEEK